MTTQSGDVVGGMQKQVHGNDLKAGKIAMATPGIGPMTQTKHSGGGAVDRPKAWSRCLIDDTGTTMAGATVIH
jgi:hypothetical protein